MMQRNRYEQMLERNFNTATADHLMGRHQVDIDKHGTVKGRFIVRGSSRILT